MNLESTLTMISLIFFIKVWIMHVFIIIPSVEKNGKNPEAVDSFSAIKDWYFYKDSGGSIIIFRLMWICYSITILSILASAVKFFFF